MKTIDGAESGEREHHKAAYAIKKMAEKGDGIFLNPLSIPSLIMSSPNIKAADKITYSLIFSKQMDKRFHPHPVRINRLEFMQLLGLKKRDSVSESLKRLSENGMIFLDKKSKNSGDSGNKLFASINPLFNINETNISRASKGYSDLLPVKRVEMGHLYKKNKNKNKSNLNLKTKDLVSLSLSYAQRGADAPIPFKESVEKRIKADRIITKSGRVISTKISEDVYCTQRIANIWYAKFVSKQKYADTKNSHIYCPDLNDKKNKAIKTVFENVSKRIKGLGLRPNNSSDVWEYLSAINRYTINRKAIYRPNVLIDKFSIQKWESYSKEFESVRNSESKKDKEAIKRVNEGDIEKIIPTQKNVKVRKLNSREQSNSNAMENIKRREIIERTFKDKSGFAFDNEDLKLRIMMTMGMLTSAINPHTGKLMLGKIGLVINPAAEAGYLFLNSLTSKYIRKPKRQYQKGGIDAIVLSSAIALKKTMRVDIEENARYLADVDYWRKRVKMIVDIAQQESLPVSYRKNNINKNTVKWL